MIKPSPSQPLVASDIQEGNVAMPSVLRPGMSSAALIKGESGCSSVGFVQLFVSGLVGVAADARVLIRARGLACLVDQRNKNRSPDGIARAHLPGVPVTSKLASRIPLTRTAVHFPTFM
jgi:hypothetical protein